MIQCGRYTLLTRLLKIPFITKRILETIKAEVENAQKMPFSFNFSRNEGTSERQITSRLNRSPKTVENQLNKVLRQLKLSAQPFFGLLSLSFI